MCIAARQLRHTRLKRPIPRADFTGADLHEAQMSEVEAVAADFEEALMKGTEIMNSNMCGANFAFASLPEAKIGDLCPTYHLLTHEHISAPLSTHRAHTGRITRAHPQTQPISRRPPGTMPISAIHFSMAYVRSILLEPTPAPTLQASPRLTKWPGLLPVCCPRLTAAHMQQVVPRTWGGADRIMWRSSTQTANRSAKVVWPASISR